MENNSFLCTICGSSFRERWELHSHTQKSHDTRVFKCTICEKEVVGQRKMEGHKQSHKKKSCNICWIQIPINSFRNHRAKCEGIMLHCDLCEYETPKKTVCTLSHRGTLARHMENTMKLFITQNKNYVER